MITAPLKPMCPLLMADLVRILVQKRDPAFVALVKKVGTDEGLVAFLRALPQVGHDGVAMPRSPLPDPNAVERAALFVAQHELLLLSMTAGEEGTP